MRLLSSKFKKKRTTTP